jgi:hypothetical protein
VHVIGEHAHEELGAPVGGFAEPRLDPHGEERDRYLAARRHGKPLL